MFKNLKISSIFLYDLDFKLIIKYYYKLPFKTLILILQNEFFTRTVKQSDNGTSVYCQIISKYTQIPQFSDKLKSQPRILVVTGKPCSVSLCS